MHPTEGRAQRILEPHYETIRYAFEIGLREWREILTERPFLSARTRACVVNDVVREKIRTRYQEDRTVYLIDKPNLFILKVDQFAIRFKKLRPNYRPSNIPTRQSFCFDNQLEFEGMPRSVYVNAGYMPDRMWTRASYFITYINGNEVEWVLDLSAHSPATPGEKHSEETSTSSTSSRVRAKIKKAE